MKNTNAAARTTFSSRLGSQRRSGWLRPFPVVAACLVFCCAKLAYAGWLSFVTGVVSFIGAGVAAASVIGSPAVGGIIVGQVAGIGTDVVKTCTNTNSRSSGGNGQPYFAALPEPSPACALADAFLNTTFQPISLPGDETDDMVAAGNVIGARFNILAADSLAGASAAQIDADLESLALAYDQFANKYIALGLGLEITQAEINAARIDIAANGLPAVETQVLQDAGWSQTDIDAFATYVATTDIILSGPSVSLAELLSFASVAISPANLPIPTASEWGLVAMALLTLTAGTVVLGRRRVAAA